MKTSLKITVAALCVIILYAAAWKYLLPIKYQKYDDGYYSTNQDTTTVKNEYMPKWVKQAPLISAQNLVEVSKGNATLTKITTNNANKIQAYAQIFSPSNIRVNTIYFPGWKAFANNKEQKIFYKNTQGVMDIHLPKGKYILTVLFEETLIRKLADGMSLITILILIIFWFVRNKPSCLQSKE